MATAGKEITVLATILLIAFSATPARCPGGEAGDDVTLWPEIELFETY